MKRGLAAARHGHAFISYVWEDRRRVDRLQGFLETNGVPVWRDTNLRPGEDWRVKIREAIAADSLAFVACFSKNSAIKEKSYQRDELLLAIEQFRLRSPSSSYLLPVRFDDCLIPELDIGAGRTLNYLQHVDLFGKQWRANAERLLEEVQHILRPAADERGGSRTSRPQHGNETPLVGGSQGHLLGRIRRRSRLQLLVAFLTSLAIIALTAFLGFRLFGNTSGPGLPAPPPGVTVMDNTGAISVIVPQSWGNVGGDGWYPRGSGVFNGKFLGPGLNASPNIGNWFNDLITSGIFVGASKLLVAEHYNPQRILSTIGSVCDFSSQQQAASHGLTGYEDLWTCRNSTTRFETVALWPKSRSFIAFIELKIVTPVDEASGLRALSSLSIRY